MEQPEKIKLDKAISYLKAGYELSSIIDKKEVHFFFKGNLFLVYTGESFFSLNEYSFKDIYKETTFLIVESSDEETVDIKKDEEYYSWRQ